MNASHLIHRLGELSKMGMGNTDPMPVVIVLSDPALGARRVAEIQSIDLGIDWEHGRVLLTPDRRLYTRDQEDEIQRLNRELDQIMLELMRLKRKHGEK